MKTFNIAEDQMLNQLAVAYAGGDQDAGDKFMNIVLPKLESYARKLKRTFHSEMEVEDIAQIFGLLSIKCCYKFAEKYNNGKNNVMGLVYKACRNKFQDIGRGDSAEKRASKMVIGYDENGDAVYENREISLQTKVGEDGDSTMSDLVAFDQKSVEDCVVDNLNASTLEMVVKDFVSSTKGRNSKIVPLVYKANKHDWSNEKLEDEIGKVLFAEKGEAPKPATIRKAKSRAIEALREAILDGKIQFSNQLEWEF